MLLQPLFLHSFLKAGPLEAGFSGEKAGLAYSIMVVRQILVLFVLVRIQVGQLFKNTLLYNTLSGDFHHLM